MAAGTVPKNIPKEYEQDFAIRELRRDIEKITKKLDDNSNSITSLHVSIVEMKSALEGKINKLDARVNERTNEVLWKILAGTGILLGIFKYFS